MLSPLLAVFISGGNFTPALTVAVLLAAFCGFTVLTKRFHWVYALTLGLFLVGMFVSVLAPGNAVRQARAGGHMNALLSVFVGVKTCVQYFSEWLTLPLVVAGAFFVPLVWPAVKGARFSFRFPMLFTVASFTILSVGFVPPLYGMWTAALGRLLNAQYDFFLLLFFANLVYYAGWLSKRLGGDDAPLYARLRPLARGFTLFCALLFAVCCCPPVAKGFTTWRAISIVLDGSAAQYDREATARLALFEGDDPVVYAPPLSAIPDLICPGDLSANPDYHANVGMAKFFQREAVILAAAETP